MGAPIQPVRAHRRSLLSLQAGLGPVADRLDRIAGLGVVMRKQRRIIFGDLGKLGRQHVGDATVPLTTSRSEQRVVGGVLDQRMLESVARSRKESALLDQFLKQKTITILQTAIPI